MNTILENEIRSYKPIKFSELRRHLEGIILEGKPSEVSFGNRDYSSLPKADIYDLKPDHILKERPNFKLTNSDGLELLIRSNIYTPIGNYGFNKEDFLRLMLELYEGSKASDPPTVKIYSISGTDYSLDKVFKGLIVGKFVEINGKIYPFGHKDLNKYESI